MTLFSRSHTATGSPVTSTVIGMTTSASVPTESEGAIRGGTVTDRLVEANGRYAEAFTDPGMDARPVLHVAVVACMDARIDLHAALGLELGDCHTIRNAGGVVTDDVIRSLALSQRKLGTREIMVVQHTSCGLSMTTDDEFKDELEADTGLRPTWAVEAFKEVKDSVRTSMARLRHSVFLPHKDSIRGFVYDVHNGALHEVLSPGQG